MLCLQLSGVAMAEALQVAMVLMRGSTKARVGSTGRADKDARQVGDGTRYQANCAAARSRQQTNRREWSREAPRRGVIVPGCEIVIIYSMLEFAFPRRRRRKA